MLTQQTFRAGAREGAREGLDIRTYVRTNAF